MGMIQFDLKVQLVGGVLCIEGPASLQNQTKTFLLDAVYMEQDDGSWERTEDGTQVEVSFDAEAKATVTVSQGDTWRRFELETPIQGVNDQRLIFWY